VTNIAIFGAAGAIGHSLAAELNRRGIGFRAVGRHRERLTTAFPAAEVHTANFEDKGSTLEAARGIDTIFYAAGAPYTNFALHPVMMQNVVDAAIEAGVARLVVIGTVYSYGLPQTMPVSEQHPRKPNTYKGRMRKKQEDIALAAHTAGELQAMVVHLPDFYGPQADLSFAKPVFDAALQGKRADWLGPVNRPHEFIYTPDAGAPLLDLAALDDAYGQHWNLGGVAIISRDFLTKVYEAAGNPPQWRAVPGWTIQLAGFFNSMLREVAEMSYLWKYPVILDDRKLRARLKTVKKTPYDQGIRETVAFLRGSR
jgi:nucleoside-diphosphate-sugar epimerase